jgi:uncharacterized protein (TIGR03435 family)
VRSDKYTIEAVGDSTDAAILQGPMLMDLLERRFNLKLRVETEEIPFYALTIAKGGLKIKPLENDSVKYEELRKVSASGQRGPGPVRRLLFPPDSASLLGCSPTNLVPGNDFRYVEALRRDGQPPMCGFSAFTGPNTLINSGASPLSLLVDSLGVASGFLRPTRETPAPSLSDTLNGLLILDKTGLPDTNCLTAIPSAGTPCAPLFNYFLEYAKDESDLRRYGRIPTESELLVPKAPTIFAALEKQLGLHLEKSKAPREFIVIEHIERPSPN